MVAKQGKGRPVSTPVETAKRMTVKAACDLIGVQREFEDLLCLTPEDKGSDREKEVRSIASQRLNVASRIVEVMDAKKVVGMELKRSVNKPIVTMRLEEQLDGMKTQEAELYNQLWEIPELGATQQEWDEDYDADMKVRPLGRPGLTIEMKVVRAQNASSAAESDLRKEERRAKVKSPFDVSEAAEKKLAKKKESKAMPGKPKLDELGRLDKKLQLIEKNILRVKSEEEGNNVYSEKGNLLGRKRKPMREKLKALNAEKAQVKSLIKTAEAVLSPAAALRRKVKVLRDKARRDKLASNSATTNKASAVLLKKYESKRAKALSLENQAEELEASSAAPAVNVDLDNLTDEMFDDIKANEERLLEAVESLERQASLKERMEAAQATINKAKP